MIYLRFIAIILAYVGLSACASLGIEDRKLAEAEPLFGKMQDQCLDDPEFILAISAPTVFYDREVCKKLLDQLRSYDFSYDFSLASRVDARKDEAKPPAEASSLLADRTLISRWRRNEVVDGLVALSNRKCGRYSSYLKTFDGQTNSLLSLLAIVTGGIGGIAKSESTARALAGSSSIFSGSRAAINESWFSSQTIHVLVAGYEKTREEQLRDITNRQACPIQAYTLMDGFGDALKYHASCSLLTGLASAAQAIERSDQPSLETIRRQLADLSSLREQGDKWINSTFVRNPVVGSLRNRAYEEAHLAMITAEVNKAASETAWQDALQDEREALKTAEPLLTEEEIKARVAASSNVIKKKGLFERAMATLQEKKTLSAEEEKKLYDLAEKEELERKAGISKPAELTPSAAVVATCPFTTTGN